MFWNRLRSLFSEETAVPNVAPDTRFGRYSDAFPAPEQVELRQNSRILFEEGEYLEAYEMFFRSLQDDTEANVELSVYPEIQRIDFKVYQGSKVVFGHASPEEVVAEVRVVRAPELQVALSRKLIELNHSLLYSCFSLNEDQVVCMRFSTQAIDGYPDKLYSGLREIAISADRQDDVLLDEFPSLEHLDDQHIIPSSDAEKSLKAEFFQQSLQKLHEDIERWESIDAGGAVSYLILAWTYKVDYLLKPEGPILSRLEKIHQLYFDNKSLASAERNLRMRRELERLSELSETQIRENFYQTRSTFGVARPLTQSEWQEFSQKYLQTLEWCRQNNQSEMGHVVTEFMVGYALFNFGMPLFLRATLHLLVQIFSADYFSMLSGEGLPLFLTKNELNTQVISAQLTSIQENARQEGFSLIWQADEILSPKPDELGRRIFVALAAGDWGL